jgi:hypothetical protein
MGKFFILKRYIICYILMYICEYDTYLFRLKMYANLKIKGPN